MPLFFHDGEGVVHLDVEWGIVVLELLIYVLSSSVDDSCGFP